MKTTVLQKKIWKVFLYEGQYNCDVNRREAPPARFAELRQMFLWCLYKWRIVLFGLTFTPLDPSNLVHRYACQQEINSKGAAEYMLVTPFGRLNRVN